MQQKGLTPDVIKYTTSIDACMKSELVERALPFFAQMHDKHITPNANTYSIAIDACANGGKAERESLLIAETQPTKKILDR